MLNEDLIKGAKGAAEFLGVSRPVVYAMVAEGNLPVIRKKSRMFFRRSELEAAFRSEAVGS